MVLPRINLIASIVAGFLLIPFLAMQFRNEVDWSLGDFIVMGSLLTLVGLAVSITLNKFKTIQSRMLICGLIIIGFGLIWAELAVGIIGSPVAGS